MLRKRQAVPGSDERLLTNYRTSDSRKTSVAARGLNRPPRCVGWRSRVTRLPYELDDAVPLPSSPRR
jgi:hypothetical protein